MTNFRLHQGDLDSLSHFGDIIAVDTETMGLNISRDRLCLVQLSTGDGTADLVVIKPGHDAPKLKELLTDRGRLKLMHFARFDAAVLEAHFSTPIAPLFCTKIASKLARTYTDRHSLKDLVGELLGVSLSKQMQSSDWGQGTPLDEQISYAASDVLYLHKLKEKLEAMLKREGRYHLVEQTFAALPARVSLDLAHFTDDIFSHS